MPKCYIELNLFLLLILIDYYCTVVIRVLIYNRLVVVLLSYVAKSIYNLGRAALYSNYICFISISLSLSLSLPTTEFYV